MASLWGKPATLFTRLAGERARGCAGAAEGLARFVTAAVVLRLVQRVHRQHASGSCKNQAAAPEWCIE